MNIPLNNFGNSPFKTKRQGFGLGSLIAMIFIGAAFTAVGFIIYQSTIIDKNWTRVQGEIVDVTSSINDGSTTYTPIIKYEVNGQSYRAAGSNGSSSYPNIGSMREVAYNPDRPDQSKAVGGAGSKIFILLFPAIGVLLLILAPFSFIKSLKRSGKIKDLTQTGQKLSGVLVDILSTGGGNNNTYKIVVAATDNTGTVQNYTSDNVNGAADLAMADFRNNPIPIDVYVDPTNQQNYYVDISDIPNLTPQRIGELIKSAISTSQPTSIIQNAAPTQTLPAQPLPTELPKKTW